MSTAVKNLCQGELIQILNRDQTITKEKYFKILENKTAILFENACKCGGKLSKTSTEMCHAVSKAGHHLGMLFQLSDDLLDFFDTKNELHKITGQDFQQGEMTLPLILLFEKSPKEKHKNLINIIKEKKESEIETIKKEIMNQNIIEDIESLINQHYNKTIQYIEQ